MIFAPKSESHRLIHSHPIISIHNGSTTFHPIHPFIAVSNIAARGQIALATTLSPWANVSRAIAKISGIVKSELIDCFVFLIDVFFFNATVTIA